MILVICQKDMGSIYLDDVAEKIVLVFSLANLQLVSKVLVDGSWRYKDVDVTPMKAVNKCNKHMQQQ